MTSRLRVLFRKEWLDLGRHHGALVPIAIVTLITLVLPIVIAGVVPALTGQPLGDDRDLAKVSLVVGHPELTANARVQLFLFQQFLLLFLLTPVTGAMALATHAVVGEKQARTLEPLLATPVATWELLVAKVIGALLPTLGLSGCGLLVYVAWMAAAADPGVLAAMVSVRMLLFVVAVGPLLALVAVQVAVIISSRANDPRAAQQFGVLIIVPLTALLVAQFTGAIWLSATMLAWMALGLAGLWVVLALVSVAVFDREHILTRWR